MQEIRFHGRGGQGTVVASVLLAKAYFRAGLWVQTFPLFGVERRGAPVEAYLRLDAAKVQVRTNVYTPDHLLIQDRRLLQMVDVTRGLKPGGWILLNAPAPPADTDILAGFRLAWVDATRIARDHRLGTRTHPIVNTAMVGAFARVLGAPPLELVTAAIEDDIRIQPRENVLAAQQAYEEVVLCGQVRKY